MELFVLGWLKYGLLDGWDGARDSTCTVLRSLLGTVQRVRDTSRSAVNL